MIYPKILIIGQHFDKQSGGGITLSNLFCGWDKNNIAVAASHINNPEFSVCEKYYRFGNLEIKRNFPFNILFKKQDVKSCIILKSSNQNSPSVPIKVNERKLVKIKNHLLFLTGQFHRINRLEVSKEFLKWINDFSPDIIYSQLSSFELIRFIRKIQLDLKKPVVVHMMDDWPVTITNKQRSIFRFYWTHLIDRELRKIFANASVLMSISEAMSEAYYARYRKVFIPFHNPIAIDDWLPYSKKDWSIKDTFKILYTGRLGTANNKSILFVSEVIGLFNQSKFKINLDIYTPDTQTDKVELIKSLKGVEVRQAVPYEFVPQLLSNYDLLILPLDFDKSGINFARYSMPTKTSEYMISGTPILVFADMQTALAKYASEGGWAYVVSENDSNKFTEALNELISNEDLRKSLVEKAKDAAIQNEDAIVVREKFRKCFIIK